MNKTPKKKINTEWVAGKHAVLAFLQCSPQHVQSLWMANHKDSVANAYQEQNQLELVIKKLGLKINYMDKQELEARCGHKHHQGVAMQIAPPKMRSENELADFLQHCECPLILILDQVQDPHNFGACLRTADAAGVDAVIVARDNACPLSSTVRKVASGAAETMPIFQVTNLVRSIELLKKMGLWVVGTSDKAHDDIYQQDMTMPIALVLGAEGNGMRKLTAQKCDFLVSLPMSGHIVSSLNVSVSAGVCLYEIKRQRVQKNLKNTL